MGGAEGEGRETRLNLSSDLEIASQLSSADHALRPAPSVFLLSKNRAVNRGFQRQMVHWAEPTRRKTDPLSGPEQMPPSQLKHVSGTAQNSAEAGSGKNPHLCTDSEKVEVLFLPVRTQ